MFASIAAIELLGERSSDEVVNQADCVSMRPPPPDCQVAAVAPEFVPGDPGFTSPTTAPPIPEPPPTATVGPVTVPPDPVPTGEPWLVSVAVSVAFPASEPPLSELPPVPVRARVRLVDPATPTAFLPISEFVTCVTDIFGACDLEYTVPGAPFPDVPALRIDQVVVDSVPPAVVNPPGVSIDVLRPPLP